MADELDDLIANLDAQAYGSMYPSQNQQPTQAPRKVTNRVDSLADLLNEIDLNLDGNEPAVRTTELMNYPVEVPDWQREPSNKSMYNNNQAPRQGSVYGSQPSQPRQNQASTYNQPSSRQPSTYGSQPNNQYAPSRQVSVYGQPQNQGYNQSSSRQPSTYGSQPNNQYSPSRQGSVYGSQSSYAPAGTAQRSFNNSPNIQTATIETAEFFDDFDGGDASSRPGSTYRPSSGTVGGGSSGSTYGRPPASTYGGRNQNRSETFDSMQTSHIPNSSADPNSAELKAHDKICFSCNQLLGGAARILAGGKLFHVTCWNCKVCKKNLGQSKYYIKDDQPYCEGCMGATHTEICKKCNQAILGQMVEAMKGTFHPSCFVCGKCGRTFGEKGFFVKNDTPYCDECIKNPGNPGRVTQCKGCGGRIEGEGSFGALGAQWHRRCFKCGVCNVELWNQAFSGKDGKGYCLAHSA